MESLAILVAIIFLVNLLAGPLAIALTWSKLVKAIGSQSRVLALILTIFRRLTHGLLVSIGIYLGGWIVVIAEPPAKLVGLFSMVTSYIAFRREYFPDLFFVRSVLKLIGVSPKNGRSSGDDGHGPEGQH